MFLFHSEYQTEQGGMYMYHYQNDPKFSDRPEQIVQTKIRLLLQSDQSSLFVITAAFSHTLPYDVIIFKIFRLI